MPVVLPGAEASRGSLCFHLKRIAEALCCPRGEHVETGTKTDGNVAVHTQRPVWGTSVRSMGPWTQPPPPRPT